MTLYCQASYVDRAAAGGQSYECDADVFEVKSMVQLL
jgi:hypothetical protein